MLHSLSLLCPNQALIMETQTRNQGRMLGMLQPNLHRMPTAAQMQDYSSEHSSAGSVTFEAGSARSPMLQFDAGSERVFIVTDEVSRLEMISRSLTIPTLTP